MKLEKRRVGLARRQALLADVSQRAAMRGLADALVEEHRSTALAERSRALLHANRGRSLASQGESLQHAVAFTGALASLSSDADAAQADAAQQAQWRAQALGQARTRARRQSERLDEAMGAYQAARERRENTPSIQVVNPRSQRLARLVQEGEPETPRAENRQTHADHTRSDP